MVYDLWFNLTWPTNSSISSKDICEEWLKVQIGMFSHILTTTISSLIHMIMETCDNTQVSRHDVTSQVFKWRTHSKLIVLIFEVGSLTWDWKWLLSNVVVKLYGPLLCNYQIKSQWSWYKQVRGKRQLYKGTTIGKRISTNKFRDNLEEL